MDNSQRPQTPAQAGVQVVRRADYRENYANRVEVRSSPWDFFLTFGTMDPCSAGCVTATNFQGVFLSPQMAKALFHTLRKNISEYESAFGEIRLELRGSGPTVQ